MKHRCKLGFVTTLSGRWPQELPKQRLAAYGDWLREELDEAEAVVFDHVVDTPQRRTEAIRRFRAENVDLVLMLYGAFTGDDVPCDLADQLGVPLILWAPCEPPFVRDDRLYANALVAVTMNAASLHRLEHPYHVIYGGKEDPAAVSRLRGLVTAHSVVRAMSGRMVGLFGYRPTAFYNSAFDEALIRKTFGVRMEETDLKIVFDRMETLPWSEVEADMAAVSGQYNPSALPDKHLENHSRLYLALKQLMAEQSYDFASLKCWPEMGALKTTPCAVIGRLADDGIGVFCEGDVDAGLTSMVQNYLTDQPAFITDLIDADREENTFTFWHCGNAAPSQLDPDDGITLENHPLAGRGTAFYGCFRPGPVTVARLCNLGGSYKLFLLRGQAVKATRNTKGCMARVRVDTPVHRVLEYIFKEGIPHHYSVVWADVADQMNDVCRLLGIEVLER